MNYQNIYLNQEIYLLILKIFDYYFFSLTHSGTNSEIILIDKL